MIDWALVIGLVLAGWLAAGLAVAAVIGHAKGDAPPAPPDPAVIVGECCAPGCGIEVEGDSRHVVVEIPGDVYAVEGVNTGMAAEYCLEHCPGGCRIGCLTTS